MKIVVLMVSEQKPKIAFFCAKPTQTENTTSDGQYDTADTPELYITGVNVCGALLLIVLTGIHRTYTGIKTDLKPLVYVNYQPKQNGVFATGNYHLFTFIHSFIFAHKK